MKEFFNSEPIRRALRTFMQAAVGYIAANIAVAVTDMENSNAIKALFAAAVAAGIAAVMNMESIDDDQNDDQNGEQNGEQNGGGDE